MGTKISALPAAGTLTGAEIVPLDQSGVTSSTTTGLIGINVKTAAETAVGVTPVNYRQPSDTSLVRSSRFNAATSWDYRADQRLFELYLSKYGAVFNGTTDDSAAIADSINAMLALVGSSGPRRVIMPSGGLTAKIGTAGAITWYCGAVGIDFNGMILDASSITSGNVVTVTGRGSSPYARDVGSVPIEHFTLLGSTSEANTPTMLYVNGGVPQAGSVSGGMIRNFSVSGGNVGIDLISNVYICTFVNASIQAQTQYGVRFTGGSNTGEQINFHNGQISNVHRSNSSGIGLYLTTGAADADLNFFGTSIDYCDSLIELLSGRLTLCGCHLENGITGTITSPKFVDVQQAAVTSYSSAFRMKGGILYIGGTAAPTAILTASNANQSTIEIDATIENPNSWAVQLLEITDSSSPGISFKSSSLQYWNSPVLTGPLNVAYNGGFELGTLVGWTTGGTGYTWTADSASPHSGTYAMKCVSISAATGSAVQTIPVRAGQRFYSSLWTSVTALTAGTFGAYAKFFQDAAGTNAVSTKVTLGLYTTTTAGYIESVANGVIPPGANYMQIAVTGTTFTGTAYVDDIEVAVF